MVAIKTVALVGTGVIGAGWAARLLHFGYDVVATDPGATAERTLREAVANAEPALAKLTLVPLGSKGRLIFTADLEAAVLGADFVQESAPEREELKRELLARVSRAARPEVVIASSSSGLLPSRIQADCLNPERILIGHPFNPVYLLPLVEVVGGRQTSEAAIGRAIDFYTAIGMHPLRVRHEIEGYLSDRLQEAVWRESLHLVNDGIATTDELDRAIAFGPGLRWAFMGTCLAFHLAGGEQGMRHMLRQFGPALKLPWTRLEAPELSEALIDRMVEGTEAQAAGRSIRELERLRDDCLLAVMQALKAHDTGAGRTLRELDGLLDRAVHHRRFSPQHDLSQTLRLHDAIVRAEWVDYNGHMTESRYLQVFGDATDALLRYIGMDAGYVAGGHSFYTVETHIMHLEEAATSEPLAVATQVLHVDAKRLHILHDMRHATSGTRLATAEHMLLHVDAEAGRACPAGPDLLARLEAIATAHAHLPRPAVVGRHVGQPR